MTYLASDSIGWNPASTDRILLAGDEAALPTIRTIVATLAANARGHIFIEVASDAEVGRIDAPGRFSISWLVRDRGQQLQRSVDAWLSEMLPVSGVEDHTVYAWIAGSGSARVLSSN